MKCIVCGKEFESKRETAKYCSSTCRVAKHRVSVTKDRVSVTNSAKTLSVTKHLNADELYARIRRYPGDKWKDSAEYKELMLRLETLSVDELEEQGFWVPNWKWTAEQGTPFR